jgi:predicted Zn-dependent protease
MTRFEDRYGYAITTTSADAADHYVRGIDLALSADSGAPEAFEAALAADEDFALAEVALGRMRQLRGEPAEARAIARRARALAERLDDRRERQHIIAMSTVIDGSGAEALDAVKAHVAEFPRDAFVLSPASGVFGLIGFGGSQQRNEEQLALLEPLRDAYGDDWWYLSALSFAYNELNRPEDAAPLVERSLELYPRNAHGAHTKAHVQFELGQASEGVSYLGEWLPAYTSTAQLHRHLQWHYTLFLIESGDLASALDVYERHIRPGVAEVSPLGTLTDAASFLWRYRAADPEAELPWRAVRDHAASSFREPGVQFADVHAAMAYAGCGDFEALEGWIERLWRRERSGKGRAGEVAPKVAESLAAFARGDYATAATTLDGAADEVVRLGGSHAQREVFEDTLVEAWLRAGEGERAAAKLRERLARRPSARDESWLEQARQLVGSAVADG